MDGVNEFVVQGSAQLGNGSEIPAWVLADEGSQAFALAPTSSFPPGTLVPARKPLAISSVGGQRVPGERMKAPLDLGLEVKDQGGNAGTLICEHAYVYAADITNGFINGYPGVAGVTGVQSHRWCPNLDANPKVHSSRLRSHTHHHNEHLSQKAPATCWW